MGRAPELKPIRVELRGEVRWVVNLPESINLGKRGRRYFTRRVDAENEITRLKEQRDRFGKSLSMMTTARIVESAECYSVLDAAGLADYGLRRVVSEWLEDRRIRTQSITWRELIDQYVTARSDRNPEYLTQVRAMASRWTELLDRKLTDLSHRDFEQRLAAMTVGSRRQAILYLRALFSFAVGKAHLESNPAKRLETPRTRRTEPAIMAPKDVEKLLYAALENDTDLLPWLVIGFFAGVRPGGELLRLRRENIRDGMVILEAAQTKKHKRRIIEVRPCLYAWLELVPDRTGLVVKIEEELLHKRRQRLCEAMGVKWSQDVTRHSFASYSLALFKDREKLCQEMGHANPLTLERHYLGLASAEDAERFWSIFPPASRFEATELD